MTQHRNLDYGQRLPEAVIDALQELLGTYVSANFKLVLANATTLQLAAGTVDDQICIAIDGRWRWITSPVNAAHPGGAAGTHSVYVTASDNAFVAGTPETDNTVYTFGLQILTSGVPGTALSRKVADITWDGAAITSIIPTVPVIASIGSITSSSILDGTIVVGDIAQSTWVAVHPANTLALRPPASAANAGYLYCATDVDGGSIYRSDGVAWTRFGAVNVVTAMIGDAQVTLVKLAANSVDASKIVDGSVGLAELATDSVNASKIVDLSVGTAELADGSVTLAKHAANSVDASKIVDGSVTRRELENGLGMDQLSFGAAYAQGVSAVAGNSILTALECSAGTGLQVSIARGLGYVQGGDAANQGMYLHALWGTGLLTIVGNGSGNPRIDAIVVRFNDPQFTGRTPVSDIAGNLGNLEQVQGTPAAGATLVNLTGAPGKGGGPATPLSALILAYLLVPNGASSFTGASFLDQRKPAGPAIWGEDGFRYRIGIDAAGNIGKERIA